MPDLRTIKVYPTQENVNILQYRDKADNCFSLRETEVPCPMNKNEISEVPIQN